MYCYKSSAGSVFLKEPPLTRSLRRVVVRIVEGRGRCAEKDEGSLETVAGCVKAEMIREGKRSRSRWQELSRCSEDLQSLRER